MINKLTKSQTRQQLALLGGCECKDIDQVIAEQTTCQDGEEWKFICKDCRHWEKGTVGCRKNYFIATVGTNIPKCMGYEQST